MPGSHYDTLGLKSDATQSDVKSAYRRLVLQHHPDRTKDPRSAPMFLKATEAYEVLSDPARRKVYDETLVTVARRLREIEEEAQERAKQRAQKQAEVHHASGPDWSNPAPPISEQVQRLAVQFKRGRTADAEQLAKEITRADPKQPLPYAILGDIARSRGNVNEAAKMYAYAAQFDPRNPVYQRKYEEILGSARVVTGMRSRVRLESNPETFAPVGVGAGIVLVGSIFVALSKEAPIATRVTLISTWTFGLCVMLFLAGVAVGSSLAIGNLVERFQAMVGGASGRIGAPLAIGTVAIVSFWGATLLYFILGIAQRAFSFSTTRVISGVVCATALLAIGAAFGGSVDPRQVLAWGGNLVYLGALCGWMVTDVLRPG